MSKKNKTTPKETRPLGSESIWRFKKIERAAENKLAEEIALAARKKALQNLSKSPTTTAGFNMDKPTSAAKQPTFDNALAKFWNTLLRNINFATIVYVAVIFSLYFDWDKNKDVSIVTKLLKWIQKYPVLSDVAAYLIAQPKRVFSTAIFGVILINTPWKTRNVMWAAALAGSTFVLQDQPLILLLAQALSICCYLKSNATNNIYYTTLCLLPMLYYALVVHPSGDPGKVTPTK